MHLNAYNQPPTIDPSARICARVLLFSPSKYEKKEARTPLFHSTEQYNIAVITMLPLQHY